MIWVVIGYFLQGEELQLNTEVLKAQQEELRRQVAETALLAANSERQAKAAEQLALATREEAQRTAFKEEAEAEPLFRPNGGMGQGPVFRTQIRNAGATVFQLEIGTEEPGVTLVLTPVDVFEGGGSGRIRVNGATRFPFDFYIAFTDRLEKRRTVKLQMTAPHQFRET